ncbi:Twinfilin-1 [Basidiobolus ranarum]|uniref:Twinfilin-1 n=1 Tax=Basidiobolus ranarum TaxID=34480 RepID=A0ABR2W554_9FUNG
MSHQSGIRASEELSKIFADAACSGQQRIIQISIENESLEALNILPVSGTFEEDYSQIIPLLSDRQPCFVLYRLDTQSKAGNYEWLYLSYIPNDAKVRDKMIYASTSHTLTNQLGTTHFADSIFGTEKEDLSLESYHKHRQHQTAPAPLTQREEELAEVKAAESGSVNIASRRTHVSGVNFPISDAALSELSKLKDGSLNFVQLCVNTTQEIIDLVSSERITLDTLASSIPIDQPRFTFFAYQHNHQGEDISPILFIYSCPTASSIRERMLYSSCRGSLLAAAENDVGLNISKKFEVDDPSELTSQYIEEDLHPEPVGIVKPQAFRRPAAPGRNAPSRNRRAPKPE